MTATGDNRVLRGNVFFHLASYTPARPAASAGSSGLDPGNCLTIYYQQKSADSMSLPTIILIALALAMDAFAVSLGTGVTMCKMHLRHALRMAAFFGAFQAFMPIAGWSIGRFAADLIKSYDHWVAFALLAMVGGKMLYEAVRVEKESGEEKYDPHNVYMLLALAFATSIDAAAVGISLSFLQVAIIQPSLIIGASTFVISLAGVFIGCKAGNVFGRKIEIAGGLVLIGIGVKIVIAHQFGW
jgi:putative Mn2+ efflux pump MntP